MNCEIELIKKGKLQTSLWSGGTTTQLAIFPKDALYGERNFIWRLSSARVEVEESIFTSLPGINRIIMVLAGEMTLEHKGHHRKLLKKYDQDSFSGSWTTKSYGKVVDFNLMMREGCEGKLEVIHLGNEEIKMLVFDNKKVFTQYVDAIYCVNGEISVKVPEGERNIVHKGDIILINAKDNNIDLSYQICNLGESKADLIRASICY